MYGYLYLGLLLAMSRFAQPRGGDHQHRTVGAALPSQPDQSAPIGQRSAGPVEAPSPRLSVESITCRVKRRT
jgi:hypothetical protein